MNFGGEIFCPSSTVEIEANLEGFQDRTAGVLEQRFVVWGGERWGEKDADKNSIDLAEGRKEVAMIRYALVLVLSFSSLYSSSTGAAQKNSPDYDESSQDMDTDDQTDIWFGPGIYNGVWFGSEDEFNDWHNNNGHDFNHQHWNGGQDHRGMDHGGGRGGGGGRR